MIEKKETLTIYKVKDDTGVGLRNYKLREARIYFKDGMFDECQFELPTRNKYSFDDWCFLGDVAKRIKEIDLEFCLTKKD